MYVHRQQAYLGIQRLRAHLAAALLAADPFEIAHHAFAARTVARQLRQDLMELDGFDLEAFLENPVDKKIHRSVRAVWDAMRETVAGSESRIVRVLAARRAMERVIGMTRAERLGESVAQMRQAILECKQHVDFADAQIQFAFA